MRISTDALGTLKITRGFVAKEERRASLASMAGLPLTAVKTGEVPKVRAGEWLAVLHISDLGVTRFEIADRVKTIREAGANIVEFPSMRIASDGPVMMSEAISRDHAGVRGMTPERAKEMAVARHAARLKARMPKAQAIKLWRASRYKRYEDALEHMTGWNKSAAYNELGPRNTGTGRPRK